jgi:hypothetical protein
MARNTQEAVGCPAASSTTLKTIAAGSSSRWATDQWLGTSTAKRDKVVR